MKLEPQSTDTGLTINAQKISYTTSISNWVILARALLDIDSSQIEDKHLRCCFDLWRDIITNGAKTSLGYAWLDEYQITNITSDIQEYLT